MSEQGWREFLDAGLDVHERVAAALAAGGRVVDDSGAPGYWILSDRAGNRVCICAWPDGSADDGSAAGTDPA